MAETATKHRQIVQLSTQLANQIAAGEVVERPASVVKELVENSLDAGATQIDIDILGGGKQLIRVRDNGCGIAKEQLELALAPHATSKISVLDDLQALYSFGFRGEALASISSVSKFRLTSKTQSQEQGWCAVTEGQNMAVQLSPAPSTVGTRIDVEELFHNTPARRRFLRTDKTEFAQIDTVMRQIALAHPQVTIVLKHNQRVVKRYKAAFTGPQTEQRLAVVSGQEFVNQSVRISVEHEGLTLQGWLGLPSYHRSQTDGQYFFVNNRPVRDKVLNHAIREAYYPHLPEGRHASYVLFLTIAPDQVDVNVHPTKHEVRFHDVRGVHDFIVQALEQSLHQGIELTETSQYSQNAVITSVPYKHDIAEGGQNEIRSYAEFIRTAYREEDVTEESPSQHAFISELLYFDEANILIADANDAMLVKLPHLFEYITALAEQSAKSTKLLFPIVFPSNALEQLAPLATKLNLTIEQYDQQVKVIAVPEAWNLEYIESLLADYMLSQKGYYSSMTLRWLQQFIASFPDDSYLRRKSLISLMSYFEENLQEDGSV